MNNRITLISICLIAFVSCIKDDGNIPESVNNIVERHAPDISLSGGPGGGAPCGSVNPSSNVVTYTGIYSNNVRTLLSRVSGWRTNSTLYTNDGIPPNVPISCPIRDSYVAAAVNYAWAAEAYYRLCEKSKAEEMASLMMENLKAADQLCGSAPGQAGYSCSTINIYPC